MVTDTVKSVMGICDGWGIYQITHPCGLGVMEAIPTTGMAFLRTESNDAFYLVE